MVLTVVTQGQQYNTGEKHTVTLYTNINRHAGTPSKTKTMDTMSLDKAQIFAMGLGSDGRQHYYINILIISATKQVTITD